jgi:hypothetical protein
VYQNWYDNASAKVTGAHPKFSEKARVDRALILCRFVPVLCRGIFETALE